MEGDEGVILGKASRWKPLFLCSIKIKQNVGCTNKEYNAISKNIHQIIRVYHKSKKNIYIDQLLEKCYCILGIIRTEEGVGKQVWFTPNKILNFYSYLSLEVAFPALKVKQNYYIDRDISSWKLPILSKIESFSLSLSLFFSLC